MHTQQLKRCGLRRGAISAFAVVLAFAAFPSAPAKAESRNLYLDGNGTPHASLIISSPTSSSLANHDSARNTDPGLTIEKGGSGVDETDAAKHQLWVGPAGGVDLDGSVSFTFWSAMKDFDPGQKGSIWVYLLDCTTAGTGCTTIDSATKIAKPWNSSGTWIANTLSFGKVNHTVAADRAIALKIVVRGNSNDDMWFAYDTTAYASRLTMEVAALPPTTTTTTAPTTTTTTTTTTAPTTLTPDTTTTTTAPPTTTTTTAPPTLTPDTTTTTTAAPGTVESDPPEFDVAMAALPDGDNSKSGGTPGARSMSGALFEGLDVAIPPFVASAILSPLMIIEALIAAFVDTARELILPTLVLLVASIWMLLDMRRDRRRKAVTELF